MKHLTCSVFFTYLASTWAMHMHQPLTLANTHYISILADCWLPPPPQPLLTAHTHKHTRLLVCTLKCMLHYLLPTHSNTDILGVLVFQEEHSEIYTPPIQRPFRRRKHSILSELLAPYIGWVVYGCMLTSPCLVALHIPAPVNHTLCG